MGTYNTEPKLRGQVMKEFNAEAIRLETASALETVRQVQAVRDFPACIGLDMHKETIVVGDADAGRD